MVLDIRIWPDKMEKVGSSAENLGFYKNSWFQEFLRPRTLPLKRRRKDIWGVGGEIPYVIVYVLITDFLLIVWSILQSCK